MGHGGARPGAGKPKGHKSKSTLSKEIAREELRKLVLSELEPMTRAQMDVAQGIKYLVYRSKLGGKFSVVTEEMAKGGIFEDDKVIIEVWDKQPSTQAFTDLMNRALDKPKEQEQEISVTIGSRAERVIEARKREESGKR